MWPAVSSTERSAKITKDPSRDSDRVGSIGQRTTDHQIVGALLDRLDRRQDAHLVVSVGSRRPDPGNDETELLATRRPNVLDVLARDDDAVQPRGLRFERERCGTGESLPRVTGEHRDGHHQWRVHAGRRCATLRPAPRGPHHGLASQRVDVQHRDAETSDVGGGSLHGVRDVMKLAVHEDGAVRGDPAHGLGADPPCELQPDFEHADVRRQQRREAFSFLERGNVESRDERVRGARDHGSSRVPNPAGTRRRARRFRGDSRPFALR